MIIKLTRAWAPDELGREVYAICEESFTTEPVVAQAATTRQGRWRDELGHVCRGCIEHMGRHPSGQFPTIEEYRDALARFPAPIWNSEEELEREDPEWERTPQLADIPRA